MILYTVREQASFWWYCICPGVREYVREIPKHGPLLFSPFLWFFSAALGPWSEPFLGCCRFSSYSAMLRPSEHRLQSTSTFTHLNMRSYLIEYQAKPAPLDEPALCQNKASNTPASSNMTPVMTATNDMEKAHRHSDSTINDDLTVRFMFLKCLSTNLSSQQLRPDETESTNPLNWLTRAKWIATLFVSVFGFITLASSTMITPAIPRIAHDLNISLLSEAQLTLSAFPLGYAFGPLFWGPLSEVYGRVRIIQFAGLVFFVCNLVCGFVNSQSLMIAVRFLSGVGGSAALSVSVRSR